MYRKPFIISYREETVADYMGLLQTSYQVEFFVQSIAVNLSENSHQSAEIRTVQLNNTEIVTLDKVG